MPDPKTFSATLDSLGSIREFITNSGKAAGLDKSKTYKLSLAVDEIATNIINYGYIKAGIENGIIDIVVKSDDEALKVILMDSAIPFNPLNSILPDKKDLSIPLEERPIGGLGIMLAKENVDKYIYEYKDKKNRNIFIVYRK